jgi:pyrroloquinoline quinone (PQQ) biosynthesis protein C
VAPELHALSHWCWHTSSADSLIVAIAATNYAIEGATGEWSALVCSNGVYAASFPEEDRKRAMKWLKMHAQYDDAHPWEALEIICTLAGTNPSKALQDGIASGRVQELRLHVPLPGALHAAGAGEVRW